MKFFKKTDILIVLAIVFVSIALWNVYGLFNSKKVVKAEIYYYSDLVETVDLNDGVDKKFSIPQDKNVVFHKDKEGNIWFEESDCPDKICIKSGKLHLSGQSAACLPNGIVLKIVPVGERTDDDLDIIG
jgi:hypothetical protein